jgi:hypothetical protein
MSEPLDPNQSEVLIQKYLAGQLMASEAEHLLALLRERPSLGTDLLNHLQIDDMLSQLIRAEAVASPLAVGKRMPRADAPQPSRFYALHNWNHPWAWATGLAACLAVLFGVSLLSRPKVAGPRQEAETRAVAVLNRAVNVEWATPDDVRYPGAALAPGWLRLKAGVLQLEFFNGASVVLEGPAELEVVSAREAFCKSGKLSAEAPPSAHGFRVRTPQMNLVDLGTAFGLAVSSNGAEAHVFKGEVELQGESAAKQRLKEGEAAAMASGGAMRYFRASHSAFISAADLDRFALADQRLCQENWRTASARLNADASLVVRFDFESVALSDHTLRNLATSAAVVGDATIVGCSPAPGRWPNKNALEFCGVSSRVLLNVPGEFKSLTYAAWVRVNSLDNNYNSLFMCDAFYYGAPHWQILRTGAIRLGVGNTDPETGAEYDSPVIFTPERFGQWIHLAVVYDAVAKEVTHYVNGEALKRQRLRFETPLRLGPTQLGNWNRADRTYDNQPIRNFSGYMDEFEFFGRALSDAEIRQLYEAGQAQSIRVARAASAAHPDHQP